MVSAARIRLFLKAAVNEPLLKHQERGVEWFSAFAMIIWAITLALPGDTFSREAYASFVAHNYTEEQISSILAGVGVMRVVALIINGAWPKSPIIRIIGATAGIVIWGNIAYLLNRPSWDLAHVFTTGPGIYMLLAAFEAGNVYRAAFDARYHRKT